MRLIHVDDGSAASTAWPYGKNARSAWCGDPRSQLPVDTGLYLRVDVAAAAAHRPLAVILAVRGRSVVAIAIDARSSRSRRRRSDDVEAFAASCVGQPRVEADKRQFGGAS